MTKDELKAEMDYRQAERVGIMTEHDPSNPALTATAESVAQKEVTAWEHAYHFMKPWDRP